MDEVGATDYGQLDLWFSDDVEDDGDMQATFSGQVNGVAGAALRTDLPEPGPSVRGAGGPVGLARAVVSSSCLQDHTGSECVLAGGTPVTRTSSRTRPSSPSIRSARTWVTALGRTAIGAVTCGPWPARRTRREWSHDQPSLVAPATPTSLRWSGIRRVTDGSPRSRPSRMNRRRLLHPRPQAAAIRVSVDGICLRAQALSPPLSRPGWHLHVARR